MKEMLTLKTIAKTLLQKDVYMCHWPAHIGVLYKYGSSPGILERIPLLKIEQRNGFSEAVQVPSHADYATRQNFQPKSKKNI